VLTSTDIYSDAVLNSCAESAAPSHDRDACPTCGMYRYHLLRRWGQGPLVTWIMLNPSTADASENDATIRRCVGFAQTWDYDGIEVVNLFALRAPYPRDLLRHPDPIGPRNDEFLHEVLSAASDNLVVCAWGDHARRHQHRNQWVRAMLAGLGVELQVLGLTGKGEPSHPLRLRKSLRPRPWKAVA
jgi:hypothetical protein